MNATEEWLRYIENKVIFQRYGLRGYTKEKNTDDRPEESEENEENTKDSSNI